MSYYLLLSALLFAIGLYGVLARRSAILIFMSVELMLNSANLAFVSFARASGDLSGQVMALVVIALAAAEVAVGLGIVVAVFRSRESTSVDDLAEFRG